MSNYLKKVADEKLLYVSPDSIYYLRKRNLATGTDTDVCLKTSTLGGKDGARAARDAFLLGRVAGKLGIAHNPNRSQSTVKEVLDRYELDGHPGDDGNPRAAGKHLTSEKAALVHLRDYFKCDTEELTSSKFDNYKAWRCKNVKEAALVTGGRTVDLELNTLSNACKWAVRQEIIKSNPLIGRRRYRKASKARHAKAVQPKDLEEFHAVCGELLKDPRSAVLGWQALWEGSTGMRTNEVLLLRTDAGPGEPGHVVDGGLCIRPSKQKEVNPTSYIELRSDLKLLHEKHTAWLAGRKIKSGWWFPGRDPEKPVTIDALTKALSRLFKQNLILRKITSHGMRALYVLVRRSNGIPDEQIAAELHQTGGVQTLVTCYGQVPQFWLDGRGPKMSWTPKKFAWDHLNLGTKPAAVGISKSKSKSGTK